MQDITRDLVKSIIKKRPKDAYKNQFGHALIVAGSKGKIGAAVLSAKACLRSGVGLSTIYSTKSSSSIFHTSLPEVMVEEDNNSNHITSIPIAKKYNAVGIGPGIGTNDETINAIESYLMVSNVHTVLDADAINAIALRPVLKNYLKNEILTPHIGECKRIIGDWEGDQEAVEKIQSFVDETECVLVFKGAPTRIFSQKNEVYINSTGNPGMAKAGSGDVLTGIITALRAQEYTALDAAIVGVYVHGLSGDLAVEKGSNFSLLASEICDFLPNAFRKILGE
jgi:hydroxyethylthiazole kinase-like uncharacterized protein yjeF